MGRRIGASDRAGMKAIADAPDAALAADKAAWRALVADASAPYRRAGRFAWHFARGKLGFDPVFAHVMQNGLIRPGDRVLDIGCGQGLLASLVDAANGASMTARWPSRWHAAPLDAQVTGIDIAPREVRRARAALGSRATFHCVDMREASLPASDVVVLLDALHYISQAEQDALLAGIRRVLAPGGRLVMRVGDGAAGRRSGFARVVDHLVAFARRGRVVAQTTRTAAAWTDALTALGFVVQPHAMGRGTPFANVLLVGTWPSRARELAPSDS